MRTVFSTNDIRGRIDDTLTTDYVWTAGKAFAEWLPEDGDIILIHSSAANKVISRALSEGILLQGRNIIGNAVGDFNDLINQMRTPSVAGGVYIDHDSLQNLEMIILLDAQGNTITTETGLNEIEQLIDAGNFTPSKDKGVIRD